MTLITTSLNHHKNHIMKNSLTALLILTTQACNNEVTTGTGQTTDSNERVSTAANLNTGSMAGGCGNSLWFVKGAKINTSSYDGNGTEIATQVSTVTKVSTQGNMTISELEMKNSGKDGEKPSTMNANYKCDGKFFSVDLSGLLPGAGGTSIKSSGLQFPVTIAVGDTLPDASYTITMSSGGHSRTIQSTIRERKVESKESLTTPAGTFDCYKITSFIETETAMAGLDETSRKVMEETKKKMGRNKMTYWYAPDVTIIKTEFHMGSKLVTRSEVTSIKK
jgi:hypothetical protein